MTQGELFGYSTRPALSEHRARELGHVAIRRVQNRAEKARPGFTADAAAFIYAYLLAHGATPGELLVDRALMAGFCPPDARAFGAVFKRLVHRKLIEQCGTCVRRKGHSCSGGRVWRAV